MEYTFEDYLKGKFKILPDFSIYQWDESGKIIDLQCYVSKETIWAINQHIKDKFFEEVNERFNGTCKTLKSILSRSQIQKIIVSDELGRITNLIKSEWEKLGDLNGQLLRDVPPNEVREISRVISLSKNQFEIVRYYLSTKSNKQNESWGFIIDIGYNNLAEEYIQAEVILKYLSFIDTLNSQLSPTAIVPRIIHQAESLKFYINKGEFDKFCDYETRLIEEGYLSHTYQWLKEKTSLVDLVAILSKNGYLRKTEKGRTYKDFHYRQFFASRYCLSKN